MRGKERLRRYFRGEQKERGELVQSLTKCHTYTIENREKDKRMKQGIEKWQQGQARRKLTRVIKCFPAMK